MDFLISEQIALLLLCSLRTSLSFMSDPLAAILLALPSLRSRLLMCFMDWATDMLADFFWGVMFGLVMV